MRFAESVRIVLSLALVMTLVIPSVVLAQAWLPARGQGSATIGYQYLSVDNHLFSDGTEFDFGEIFSSTGVISLQYGILRNLAVDANLAAVAAKFGGPSGFAESGIDNGIYHGELQDFSLRVRYMAFNKPFVATPFIGVVVPTHGYETLGHAAVGRNLTELQLGLSAGRVLYPFLSDVYVQGRYAYTLTEEIGDIGVDRSNLDFAAGYFLTERITVSGFTNLQFAHDGIDWLQITSETGHAHDRLAATSYTRFGGAVAYGLFPNFDVSVSFGSTVSGENTHDAKTFDIATTWSFDRFGRR
ncbi:MAG: hypothetical protein V3V49_10435 [Candidatus Krumholzibacteria bacterium]